MTVNGSGPGDEVTVSDRKKRIYLTFRGSLSVDAARRLHDSYSRAIAQVGPGYTAVSIFEDFVPGTSKVQEIITSMIQMANDRGCRAAARVGMGSVFGPLQLGRLQRAAKASYPVKDFQTIEDAETYLDDLPA